MIDKRDRNASASTTASLAPRPSSLVERKDGRRLRRVTVYLPFETARRLAVHCAAQDIDVSAFVTALAEEALVNTD